MHVDISCGCETQKAIDLEMSLVDIAEIQAIEEQFGDDQYCKDRLDAFIRMGRVLIGSHVHLVTEDMSDDAFIKRMRESAVGKIELSDQDHGYIGIFYDQRRQGSVPHNPI